MNGICERRPGDPPQRLVPGIIDITAIHDAEVLTCRRNGRRRVRPATDADLNGRAGMTDRMKAGNLDSLPVAACSTSPQQEPCDDRQLPSRARCITAMMVEGLGRNDPFNAVDSHAPCHRTIERAAQGIARVSHPILSRNGAGSGHGGLSRHGAPVPH